MHMPSGASLPGERGDRVQRLRETALGRGSWPARWLPVLLSVIAGSTDIIGFLGLNGLFTAHITGNLVILAARIVVGSQAILSDTLSVPVFMAVLFLTRWFAVGLERIGRDTLVPLLLLHLSLLAGFFALCTAAGPWSNPNATAAVAAGMFGVSAMAVQNALVPIALKGVPSTAVMTSNVTHFMLDFGEMLGRGDPGGAARARDRALQTLPVIVGFMVGCGLGAALEAAAGLRSLALPVGLALLTVAIGLAAGRGRGQHR
jgi:uncharacterized membrane protein YoaK (UPF0700 family)